ncbi:hypothetical protein NPIL_645271 [Nephila pilipes]|uniref:Uncharacterized protein n=1 Tax=Nephila pilipes TaxID=299642 RepID=A0A8X6TYZ9_NEPPI|nr:hypothetical protein NPIL_645271 [Nephila pilipes]
MVAEGKGRGNHPIVTSVGVSHLYSLWTPLLDTKERVITGRGLFRCFPSTRGIGHYNSYKTFYNLKKSGASFFFTLTVTITTPEFVDLAQTN